MSDRLIAELDIVDEPESRAERARYMEVHKLLRGIEQEGFDVSYLWNKDGEHVRIYQGGSDE